MIPFTVCILSLNSLLLISVCAFPNDEKSLSGNCDVVKDKFKSLQFQSSRHYTEDEEKICELYSSQSCCTPEMEMMFRTQASHDIETFLKSSGALSKSSLSSSILFYDGYFTSILQESKGNTINNLKPLFKFSNEEWQKVVKGLYIDLMDSVTNNVDITKSIQIFFSEIFPYVYMTAIGNDRTHESEMKYSNCLKQVFLEAEFKPYENKPSKLAKHLDASLHGIRTYLQALRLAVDVIDTVEKLPFNKQCGNALTRLTYCAECAGHMSVKPCSGFCFNVLRGCLIEVLGLDNFYAEFINSLHRIAIKIHEHLSFESVLRLLPSELNDALQHAIRTANFYSEQVHDRCGEPRMKLSDAAHSQKTEQQAGSSSSVLSESNTIDSLNRQLTKIVNSMVNLRGLFAHLGDNICKNNLAADVNDLCWNGTAVAKYTRYIAHNNVNEQMNQNPEVQNSRDHVQSQSSEVVSLKQKLSSMIKELNHFDKSHLEMQNDAPPTDDEDASSASGNDYEGSTSAVDPDGEMSAVTSESPTTTNDIVFSSSSTHSPRKSSHSSHPTTKHTPPPFISGVNSTSKVLSCGAVYYMIVLCFLGWHYL